MLEFKTGGSIHFMLPSIRGYFQWFYEHEKYLYSVKVSIYDLKRLIYAKWLIFVFRDMGSFESFYNFYITYCSFSILYLTIQLVLGSDTPNGLLTILANLRFWFKYASWLKLIGWFLILNFSIEGSRRLRGLECVNISSFSYDNVSGHWLDRRRTKVPHWYNAFPVNSFVVSQFCFHTMRCNNHYQQLDIHWVQTSSTVFERIQCDSCEFHNMATT